MSIVLYSDKKSPYSVAELKDYLRDKGHVIFNNEDKNYNLNIVGVREKGSRPNYFDDSLHIFWSYGGITQHDFWTITTYPGTFYLLHPMSPKGAAILVPGQYLGSYALGFYKGYKALKQTESVKVYRDFNLNEEWDIDPETLDRGKFGIHIHKAGLYSKLVGPNSAGCQVFQSSEDFDYFISICEKAEKNWGNSFTYSLIEGK